jgi:hypothetical protein
VTIGANVNETTRRAEAVLLRIRDPRAFMKAAYNVISASPTGLSTFDWHLHIAVRVVARTVGMTFAITANSREAIRSARLSPPLPGTLKAGVDFAIDCPGPSGNYLRVHARGNNR